MEKGHPLKSMTLDQYISWQSALGVVIAPSKFSMSHSVELIQIHFCVGKHEARD